jgi:multiple sugar transport system substrate-binding protein
MMFLRKYILTFWVIVVMGLVSGCAVAATTPEPDPVTITFAFPRSDQGFYEQMVELFNQDYPNITVELEPLRSSLTSSDLEEIDAFLAYPDEVTQFRDAGLIVNLDPFIENDESFGLNDFYPGATQLFINNGKIWAIPAGMDVMVLFYNQDYFDLYNAPYPQIGWTWSDFLAIAQAATDPEAGNFAYGPLSYTADQDYVDLVLFIYLHGGRLFDDLQNPTTTTFDDPLTIEAVQWYADLIYEHNVAPTPSQLNKLGGTRLAIFRGIQAERFGMWVSVFSARGGAFYWPDEWPFNWGMVPMPQDAQSISQAWASGYGISSQTDKPEAAWRWVNFLSRQMPDREMPTRRSILESELYEQKVGANIVEVARNVVEDSIVPPVGIEEVFADDLEIFGQAVAEIMTGKASPFDALSQAQKQVDNR